MLDGYLEQEKSRQKDLASLLRSDSGYEHKKKMLLLLVLAIIVDRKDTMGNCTKRKGKTTNVTNQSQSFVPADCPTCGQFYSGQGKQGKEFYKTRLTSCPT